MNADVVDQRGAGVLRPLGVFDAGAVIDEQPLQGRGQQPTANAELRVNRAEVSRQRRSGRLTGDLGADDLEIDQQPLFVVDDLRVETT